MTARAKRDERTHPRHLWRTQRLAAWLAVLALVLAGGFTALAATTPPAEAQAEPAEEPQNQEEPQSQAEPAAEAGHATPQAMAELAHWAGHWRGEGWIRMGPGEPVKIDSEEWVESRLDGAALVIEGLHRVQDSGAQDSGAQNSGTRADGRVVHHALALLTWDEAAETYRFRTHVAGRGPGDFTGRMEDGAFIWGGPMGGPAGAGEMRYTIRLEDGTWHEVGDFTRDGETWNRFFEMTLTKVD